MCRSLEKVYSPANKLPNRPPNTQQGQQISRRPRQELQEKRAIDGKISTNTNTGSGVHSADSEDPR